MSLDTKSYPILSCGIVVWKPYYRFIGMKYIFFIRIKMMDKFVENHAKYVV
jgi:hypothetical protein